MAHKQSVLLPSSPIVLCLQRLWCHQHPQAVSNKLTTTAMLMYPVASVGINASFGTHKQGPHVLKLKLLLSDLLYSKLYTCMLILCMVRLSGIVCHFLVWLRRDVDMGSLRMSTSSYWYLCLFWSFHRAS